MTDEEIKAEGKKRYSVLNKKLGGGPHGLGDPDDRYLRKVEKDVLIAKKVRDRTREEKCIPEVSAFTACCKDAQYLMTFKCRKENAELKECLTKWYENKDFWDECKEQYLKERSDFRRTGEPKKIRDFKARFANSF